MTDDLTDDDVRAELRTDEYTAATDSELVTRLQGRLALARREMAAVRRERDAYATRAAEWLAEKHLADEDHASDVEIVVAREREACAAICTVVAGAYADMRYLGDRAETAVNVLEIAAKRIRARGDAGRGDG